MARWPTSIPTRQWCIRRGRRVILRASSSPSAYLFTRAELAELRQLVDGAGLMLELDG